jgi:hypothetical protein
LFTALIHKIESDLSPLPTSPRRAVEDVFFERERVAIRIGHMRFQRGARSIQGR